MYIRYYTYTVCIVLLVSVGITVLPGAHGECLYVAQGDAPLVIATGVGPSGGTRTTIQYPASRLTAGEEFDIQFLSSSDDETRLGLYDGSSGQVVMFAPQADPKGDPGGLADARFVAFPPVRTGVKVTGFAICDTYFFLAYDTVTGTTDVPLLDVVSRATGEIVISIVTSDNVVGPITRMISTGPDTVLLYSSGNRKLMKYTVNLGLEGNFVQDIDVTALAFHHRDRTVGVLSTAGASHSLHVYTASGQHAGTFDLPSDNGPIYDIEFNDGVPGFIWYTTEKSYAVPFDYLKQRALREGDTSIPGVVGIVLAECPSTEWDDPVSDSLVDVTGGNVLGVDGGSSSGSKNTVVIVVSVVAVLLVLVIVALVLLISRRRNKNTSVEAMDSLNSFATENSTLTNTNATPVGIYDNQGKVLPPSSGGFNPQQSNNLRSGGSQQRQQLANLQRVSSSTTQLRSRSLLNSMASMNGGSPGQSVHVSSMLVSSESQKSSASGSRSITDKAYRKIPLDEVMVGDCIGAGGFANVFRGQWHGIDVAIKVFRNATQAAAVDEFYKEMSILAHLRHPHIVLLLGGDCSEDGIVSIVTELKLGGSLFDLIEDLRNERKTLHLAHAWRLALDVAAGMQYLHSDTPPIVHRDLKSLNILLDEHGRASVADFGLSRVYDGTQAMTKAVGTPAWMAPELIIEHKSSKGKGPHESVNARDDNSLVSSVKVDVFSYAIVLWELVTNQVPWEGVSPVQLIARYMQDPQAARMEIPSWVPDVWRDLIAMCWHHDPDSRPGFSGIISYLQRHKEQLQIDPPRPAPGTPVPPVEEPASTFLSDSADSKDLDTSRAISGGGAVADERDLPLLYPSQMASNTGSKRSAVTTHTTVDQLKDYLEMALAMKPNLAPGPAPSLNS